MDYREPTIRSRELGEGLRAAMVGAGLNGKQIARVLDWSESKVSRMFQGTRGVSEVDVAMFLGVCGVAGEEGERLLGLCKERDTKSWFQQYGSRLPKQLRTLMDHEEQAEAIAQFEPILVPGLLQTADYAKAVIQRIVNVPRDEIEERVIARLARQQKLKRDRAVSCTFYLHEFVLRLPVGGAEVMSGQLHELLRQSVRNHISIRIVPADFGAHAGTAGTFELMEFKGRHKPVAYIESETSCLFMEQAAEIEAYRAILAELAVTALGEQQSRELIANLATELYADREDNDERA
ncbi:helix-turn-helix transcriptional regulator [Actinokineospora sp. NBRC 105648]|uniref:helix-turn-helix domain-containing protein n=1 Tax=Actinokineospora sp. NBRC 105648 TaxID=3032206 RepID=UPI0024A2EC5A|nr:helix-turn-helix transcriptional regulator [Actinokineospora sp. NBRC 105648]GLZ37674.1 transcriptional regulator [Actinokineospora sp. NBRC 105648]